MAATVKKSGLSNSVAASYINRTLAMISPETLAEKIGTDVRDLARIEMGLETSRSKTASYISAVEEIQLEGKYSRDTNIRITDRFCDLMLEFPQFSPTRGRLLALITTTMVTAHRGSILAGQPARRLTLAMLRGGVLSQSEIKDQDIEAILKTSFKDELITLAKNLGQLDLVTIINNGVIYPESAALQEEPKKATTKEEDTMPPIVRKAAPASVQIPLINVPTPPPVAEPINLNKSQIVTADVNMSIADLLKDSESAVIEVSRFRGPGGKVLYVIEVAS